MNKNLRQVELTALVCVLFSVFPLFYTNFYYNIQASKAWFFVGVVFCGFIFVSLTGLLHSPLALYLKKWKLWEVIPIASISLFLIFAAIATFVSDDIAAALLGSDGRSMGLIWLIACILCFFMCWGQGNDFGKIIRIVFAITFSIVILIGFFHALGWNIGGFLDHVPEKYTRMYLSTIGYINFFSQFASFGAVVFIGFYCHTKEKWLLPVIFISYMGLLIGNSDAGFIGWIIAVILFPILVFEKKSDIENLLLSLVLFPAACILISLLYHKFIGSPNVSTICSIMFKIPIALILIGVTAGLYLGIRCIKKTDISKGIKIYKAAVLILLGGLLLIMVVSNVGLWNNPVFTITDNWGSNRGFIWRKVTEIFNQSAPKQKWLGYGTDGMLSVMNTYCHDESIQVTGQIFDSAHNDFLFYMITIGLPGAVAYLSFWVSTITAGIRKKDRTSKVWLMVVICYAVQALLVPSQPMTTPFAFVFAGLMMAGNHRVDISN